MKIKKLNENRIQIVFNDSYLKENNIDVHTFMSNSIESQTLFLNLLDKAEDEIGFITDNYKLTIESIALTNGTFIITITRFQKEDLNSTHVQVKRKEISDFMNTQLYKFNTFDDFCNFENFIAISAPNLICKISSSNAIYKYNNSFFLILNNIEQAYKKLIYSSISEFATSVNNSSLILNKIKEFGVLVNADLIHND